MEEKSINYMATQKAKRAARTPQKTLVSKPSEAKISA
jgi:hypothetical protein